MPDGFDADNCVSPLVFPDNPVNNINSIPGTKCAFPCPAMEFSSSEYYKADIIMMVLSTISFILSLFMLLTWAVFPRKRAQYMVFYFNILMFFSSLMIFINSMMKPKNGSIASLSCANNSESFGQNTTDSQGRWCICSAIIINFCTFSAACWWSCAAADLFIKIVLGRNQVSLRLSNFNTKKTVAFHLYGFMLPAIIIALLLENKSFGGGVGNTAWCGMDSLYANNPKASLYYFYYPLLLPLVVGTTTMTATIISLYKSAKALRRSISSNSERRQMFIVRYLRAILFLVLFCALFAFIFAYRVYIDVRADKWEKSAERYVYCLLVIKPTANKLGYDINCDTNEDGKPKIYPNVNMWLFIHALTAISGTFPFIIYGTQKENFQLWARLIGEKIGSQKLLEWAGVGIETSTRRDTQIINRASITARSGRIVSAMNANPLVGLPTVGTKGKHLTVGYPTARAFSTMENFMTNKRGSEILEFYAIQHRNTRVSDACDQQKCGAIKRVNFDANGPIDLEMKPFYINTETNGNAGIGELFEVTGEWVHDGYNTAFLDPSQINTRIIAKKKGRSLSDGDIRCVKSDKDECESTHSRRDNLNQLSKLNQDALYQYMTAHTTNTNTNVPTTTNLSRQSSASGSGSVTPQSRTLKSALKKTSYKTAPKVVKHSKDLSIIMSDNRQNDGNGSIVIADYDQEYSDVKVQYLRDEIMEPRPNYTEFTGYNGKMVPRSSQEGYNMSFRTAAIPSFYEYKQYQQSNLNKLDTTSNTSNNMSTDNNATRYSDTNYSNNSDEPGSPKPAIHPAWNRQASDSTSTAGTTTANINNINNMNNSHNINIVPPPIIDPLKRGSLKALKNNRTLTRDTLTENTFLGPVTPRSRKPTPSPLSAQQVLLAATTLDFNDDDDASAYNNTPAQLNVPNDAFRLLSVNTSNISNNTNTNTAQQSFTPSRVSLNVSVLNNNLNNRPSNPSPPPLPRKPSNFVPTPKNYI